MSCEMPAPKIVCVKSDNLKNKEEIDILKAEIERFKCELILANMSRRKKW